MYLIMISVNSFQNGWPGPHESYTMKWGKGWMGGIVLYLVCIRPYLVRYLDSVLLLFFFFFYENIDSDKRFF